MKKTNEYHTNVYERITDILNLLLEADGITINLLAEKYKLSPEIVLEDIKYLSDSDGLIDVYSYDEEKDTEFFLDDLLQGKNNDVEIVADKRTGNMDDISVISLQLSPFEKVFLENFLSDSGFAEKDYISNDIYIKTSFNQPVRISVDILGKIDHSIQKRLWVNISYLNNEKICKRDVFPIKIVKMVADGLCYCMVRNNEGIEYIRLDRIEQVCETTQNRNIVEDDEIENELKLFDFRWGLHDNDGPFEFEMIVYNEANLPRRLKNELKNRKYGNWEIRTDGSWLYKDIIIDYDSLKYWVMSLGSSVKVIKPFRLREEILTAAYRRIAFYQDDN